MPYDSNSQESNCSCYECINNHIEKIHYEFNNKEFFMKKWLNNINLQNDIPYTRCVICDNNDWVESNNELYCYNCGTKEIVSKKDLNDDNQDYLVNSPINSIIPTKENIENLSSLVKEMDQETLESNESQNNNSDNDQEGLWYLSNMGKEKSSKSSNEENGKDKDNEKGIQQKFHKNKVTDNVTTPNKEIKDGFQKKR